MFNEIRTKKIKKKIKRFRNTLYKQSEMAVTVIREMRGTLPRVTRYTTICFH